MAGTVRASKETSRSLRADQSPIISSRSGAPGSLTLSGLPLGDSNGIGVTSAHFEDLKLPGLWEVNLRYSGRFMLRHQA